MQRIAKNFLRIRLLLLLLIISAIFVGKGTQKASAEVQKENPYLIKVNRTYNTITVYEQDENGRYSVPVKAMLCSVGMNGKTKIGTFQTKAKYRWKLLMGGVYGQYSTRIVDGILFHSVYYYKNGNPATLATKEYNKLGTSASHGCVRLSVKDAKWIYDNCKVGTTVVIYDDKKSPGPLGKPEGIKIASTVRWDPTDPNVNNPYNDKLPIITGVKNQKIAWNNEIDLLKGVKAKSSVGTDITLKVAVKGKVNSSIPGKYKITYSVTDVIGKTTVKNITVIVKDNENLPEFTGICDRLIGTDTIIDEEFALSGVEASCMGVKINKEDIGVLIEEVSDTIYSITYTANIANGPDAIGYSTVFIDDEAPVFSGISDSTLVKGEIPDKAYLMTNVTVSDNYTASENIKVDVIVNENPDGTYSITYEATDEAGNSTTEQATVYN